MKQLYFWLACINIIYSIAIFLFIIIVGSDHSTDIIIINKKWIFALIPLFFDLAFVFVIFYHELLEEE